MATAMEMQRKLQERRDTETPHSWGTGRNIHTVWVGFIHLNNDAWDDLMRFALARPQGEHFLPEASREEQLTQGTLKDLFPPLTTNDDASLFLSEAYARRMVECS